MAIEFANAQARAQALLGDRLLPADWQLLESSRGLAQYLHAARGTTLAPFVKNFTATSTPHVIERSLRGAWRSQVANASRWSPPPWRASIHWTSWLPDLPAIAYLRNGGTVLPWMTEDLQLADLSLAEPDVRRRRIDDIGLGETNSSGGVSDPLQLWLDHWQAMWPAVASARPGLQRLTRMLWTHRLALQRDNVKPAAAQENREKLQQRIARLMRMQMQQPLTVFCHLAITSLEMQRLRSGLVRRAFFNEIDPAGVS
ncbi:MAG: hypothetical protein OEW68_00065 [Gammaproteobacteria bacterium]|nr:hypothetical protein [Gammaproteobacteria bacterium]MDH4313218.1 hypothetical protein [Gammaproteobacteria bacterium]MDH5213576.1 hypothetical protein [Gammaproteobacteria bacterium]